MNIESILFIVNFVTIAALLLSIIYTAGVVWRVEKELDSSYKFFLAAIIFLFAGEVLGMYVPENIAALTLVIKILRMLFTLCFLIGVLLMRDIARKIDGEK